METSAQPRYFTIRAFRYGERDYEVGELIQLTGARNDEKLIRHLLREVPKDADLVECGPCEGLRTFINDTSRRVHVIVLMRVTL